VEEKTRFGGEKMKTKRAMQVQDDLIALRNELLQDEQGLQNLMNEIHQIRDLVESNHELEQKLELELEKLNI